MDEAIRKISALGLPGVILVTMINATGLTGGAAIVVALFNIGPGGIIGGIALLGVIGLATDAIAKFGVEKVLVKIYERRFNNGETASSLLKEIKKLRVSSDLKRKLSETVSIL